MTLVPEGRRKVGLPGTSREGKDTARMEVLECLLSRSEQTGASALQPYRPLGPQRIGEVR